MHRPRVVGEVTPVVLIDAPLREQHREHHSQMQVRVALHAGMPWIRAGRERFVSFVSRVDESS